jgi:hypothetical protein
VRPGNLRLLWALLTSHAKPSRPRGTDEEEVARGWGEHNKASRRIDALIERYDGALHDLEQRPGPTLTPRGPGVGKATVRFDVLHEQVACAVGSLRRAERPERKRGVVAAWQRFMGRRKLRALVEAIEGQLTELERSCEVESARGEDCQHEAERAVRALDDDAARNALARVNVHRARHGALLRELEAGRAVMNELRNGLSVLPRS